MPSTDQPNAAEQRLVAYVLRHADEWRAYLRQTYMPRWAAYDRYWRALFSQDQRTRETERSRIVTPGLMEAVDSTVSELAEATFGPDGWFDVEDEQALGEKNPGPNSTVLAVRKELRRRFDIDGVDGQLDEVLQLAAVYGSGFGELVQEEGEDRVPAEEEQEGQRAIGVRLVKRYKHTIQPHHPKNLLVPPHARNIDAALGVCVEEFVPVHQLRARQASKMYLDVAILPEQQEQELLPVQENPSRAQDVARLHRWYGLVPASLLQGKEPKPDGEDDLVECVVHIANRSRVLLAVESPFMSGKRPFFHFPLDTVPGRLHGRGVVEKGIEMQRAVDGTFRAFQDSLPFTAFPVFGADATRLPKNFKFEVYPGRTMMFNGPVSDAVSRLDMGGPSDQLLGNAQTMSRMLAQATGTVDSSTLPGTMQGVANPQVLQMVLGGVVKKHRRQLLLLQTHFIKPFLREVGMRLMQFEAEKFPVKDYTWKPLATLGMLAREFELNRLTTVMATLGPDSPILPMLLAEAITLSGLKNREELQAFMRDQAKKMAEDPTKAREIQLKQMDQLLDIEEKRASVAYTQARAIREQVNAQLEPQRVQAAFMSAMTRNLDPEDKAFERRIRMGELFLNARKIDVDEEAQKSNERIASASRAGGASAPAPKPAPAADVDFDSMADTEISALIKESLGDAARDITAALADNPTEE